MKHGSRKNRFEYINAKWTYIEINKIMNMRIHAFTLKIVTFPSNMYTKAVDTCLQFVTICVSDRPFIDTMISRVTLI